jgi:FtsP/CotA-like multicopper oxidase with cupredoxin domain
MDGAVGFTQCPISNGTTFTYGFDVDEDQSGTFWWHAHSQVQRGDGMYGGLVIHQPSAVDREKAIESNEKEVLLLIGDWYHRSADEVLSWYMSTRGFGNEVSFTLISIYHLILISLKASTRFPTHKWRWEVHMLDGCTG